METWRLRKRAVWLAGLLVAAGFVLAAPRSVRAGAEDWNDKQIKWMGYDDGLAQAKKTKQPICLIFYTTWCPHCANYSKLFSDPGLVKKSESFVMIRLDKDKNQAISGQFKPDGEYIPRTFFLSPDGKLEESLTEQRDQYKYFYDEQSPKAILDGMDRALDRFKSKKS